MIPRDWGSASFIQKAAAHAYLMKRQSSAIQSRYAADYRKPWDPPDPEDVLQRYQRQQHGEKPRQQVVNRTTRALKYMLEELDWRLLAKCKDVTDDTFFSNHLHDEWRAKQYCRGCPVLQQCLISALDHNDDGVRGGLTKSERKILKSLPR